MYKSKYNNEISEIWDACIHCETYGTAMTSTALFYCLFFSTKYAQNTLKILMLGYVEEGCASALSHVL